MRAKIRPKMYLQLTLALLKKARLNALDVAGAERILAGTARSMGMTILDE